MGGEKLSPCDQLAQLSLFFKRHQTRFVYVALPNKGNIYPERIVPRDVFLENDVLHKSVMSSPQWHKHIKNTLEKGVEVINIENTYGSCKNQENLFSLGHHISPFGAKTAAKAIGDYLNKTTNRIVYDGKFKLDHEVFCLGTSDFYSPLLNRAKCDIYYANQNGVKECFSNHIIPKNSKIAIFGDCNLQAYSSIGGGIAANLSYYLNYPVYDAGRKLVFGFDESPITREDLDFLCQFDIVIYVAFASAPFVRSAKFDRKKIRLKYDWCHFSLED